MELRSGNAWGEDGNLADEGLIPMAEAERAEWAEKITGLTNLAM